jgi:hypothetical protein
VAGYFVAAGVVTITAVAGCGFVHSARLAAQGLYGAAALQALVALTTPAVLAQTATAELLGNLIDVIRELSGQIVDADNQCRTCPMQLERCPTDHAGLRSNQWLGTHAAFFYLSEPITPRSRGRRSCPFPAEALLK